MANVNAHQLLLSMHNRQQSTGEEIANTVSHGIGMLAALVAYPILVVAAAERGDTTEIVAVSIFSITMVLLYLSSTLFHALPVGGAKRIYQIIDHAAIYLLIAGTYTPFTLGVLRGAVGWTLFGVVWGLAVVGCVLKATRGIQRSALSTWLYLTMGWIAVLAIDKIWTLIPAWGMFWLVAGGVAYTIGTLFFAMSERIRYSHFIWHLFVITGTACHFVAVLNYSI